MMRLAVAGLLALLLAPAMAQSTPPVQATCEKYLAPAYAKTSAKAVLDCGCVSRFLTGRYGAADATIIVRFFAAAATESEKGLQAAAQEIGGDRIRAVLNMAGDFQNLGRDIDQACPATNKP